MSCPAEPTLWSLLSRQWLERVARRKAKPAGDGRG